MLGEADDTFTKFTQQTFDIPKNRKTFSHARLNFLMATALSDYTKQPHQVFMYVNQLFETKIDLQFDADYRLLVETLAQGAAHELGHDIGLVHPGKYEGKFVASAVQSLTLVGDDLMASGRLGVTRMFLPRISEAGLKLSLRLGWTAADISSYVSTLVQSAQLAG